MLIQAGIQVSLDGTTWYSLTDHNRKDITLTTNIIESAKRMANGKMRKYVIASKTTIATSWDFLPAKSSETVDQNHSSAWLEAFYNANFALPIYVQLVRAEVTPLTGYGTIPDDTTFATSKVANRVYMTNITKFNVISRYRNGFTDYVNMDIEFTEI